MLEILKAKLKKVRQDKESYLANFNGCCGAEQVLLQLIADEEKKTEQNNNEKKE